MDDPIEILKAAGVECAEVDEYYNPAGHDLLVDPAFDAILALARLVAGQKGLLLLAAESIIDNYRDGHNLLTVEKVLEDLEREYKRGTP